MLLPTIAKLLNRSFTDFGTSLVDVRGVGLRRYARIFQRTIPDALLGIKVACVTDRDIMPDCAPAICFDEKYSDSTQWPKKRKWRVESDFTNEQTVKRVQELKDRADGQEVKTFVSGYWTLEYDLAYSGLSDETMGQSLITAMAKMSAPKGWEKEKDIIVSQISQLQNKKEKASYFYSFFTLGGISKAEFSQELAHELEARFAGKAAELEKVLPTYLVKAIKYVTEE